MKDSVVELGVPTRDIHKELFVDGKSPGYIILDEMHDLSNGEDPSNYVLPKLPSARRSSIMFTLSREMLRMPINECGALTYGDVFYANKLVREAGDDMKQVERLIRSEHESAANLLTWCRNDVSIAVAVANSVARLRNAIVLSDNS